MTKDKKITYTTGKIAAEKGYYTSNLHYEYYSKQYKCWILTTTKGGISRKEKTIQRPTQTALQKWLREKHNIHIELKKNIDGYSFIIYPDHELNGDYWVNYIIEMTDDEKRKKHLYKTYEMALEKGLQQALKCCTS